MITSPTVPYLPWVALALLSLIIVLALIDRQGAAVVKCGRHDRALLCVVVALVAIVGTVVVGHSGAQLVWGEPLQCDLRWAGYPKECNMRRTDSRQAGPSGPALPSATQPSDRNAAARGHIPETDSAAAQGQFAERSQDPFGVHGRVRSTAGPGCR